MIRQTSTNLASTERAHRLENDFAVEETGDASLSVPVRFRAFRSRRSAKTTYGRRGPSASEDRRLSKAHVSVHMGGATAAVQHYQESPTPNLIVVESSLPRQQLLGELDRLAECCDPGTKKVIVTGHVNDVILYRELLKRGVSEYLVAPITAPQLMESLSNLYNES